MEHSKLKPCFNNLGSEVQWGLLPLFLAISIRHHALQGLLYCTMYVECTTRADSADPLMRYAFYQGMRSPLAHGQYLISLCHVHLDWFPSSCPLNLIYVLNTYMIKEYNFKSIFFFQLEK